MAPRRVKAKEHENLSESNIERVIKLLEQPKPITKKEACAALNISYNTTRLNNILEQYKARKASDAKRRAANRGKPASDAEIKEVITDYLRGIAVSEIADGLFRSTTFVRNIIEQVGVPQRQPGENYFNFAALPEQCISEEFSDNEIVWSSKFQAAATIIKSLGKTKDGVANMYRIWVNEPFEEPEKKFFFYNGPGGFYASQPAYDLGRLEHLKQYGVDIARNMK